MEKVRKQLIKLANKLLKKDKLNNELNKKHINKNIFKDFKDDNICGFDVEK